MKTFQSTLPVRGATGGCVRLPLHRAISIHAPRAGSDASAPRYRSRRKDFNPRSPCGERRQATPRHHYRENFNPRSPCGERRYAPFGNIRPGYISIHAPRAGSDHDQTTPAHRRVFQSTLPVRGATIYKRNIWTHKTISIHAPRAGSDTTTRGEVYQIWHFNPRSPCGERLVCS